MRQRGEWRQFLEGERRSSMEPYGTRKGGKGDKEKGGGIAEDYGWQRGEDQGTKTKMERWTETRR